jgi:CheY-like chemotaxis protein
MLREGPVFERTRTMIALPHPNPSILLIEDDANIRTATAQLLRKRGYTVDSVTNGLEAMCFLGHHPLPQLILLDLRMPLMDGWQFRVQQQQDPALRRIPVLLLSSDDDLEATAQALHTPYLHKPFEVDVFFDALERQVGHESDETQG